VMLIMMNLHGDRVDLRLQRLIGISSGGKV
jgi:hypothetical protein